MRDLLGNPCSQSSRGNPSVCEVSKGLWEYDLRCFSGVEGITCALCQTKESFGVGHMGGIADE